eukprot:Skav204691  [mRNA]  locus=scaffold7486:18477:19514:+ [translate_table: standard]
MKILITGVTGQDGAYLAQSYINDGHEVVGAVRRSSSSNLWRLDDLGITERLTLVDFDLLDPHSANQVVRDVRPDFVFNLAAQSFVGVSFDQPVSTFEQNSTGVLHLLEAIRRNCRDARYYQASTSELFGLVQEVPQRETTPFYPRSPYGVAKLAAHWATINYRESYDMFACTGILFNHESPLRGPEFVTRKISIGMARLAVGASVPLELGNLEAQRDWGFAGDYVKGMRLIAESERPSDYVLATGKMHSVGHLVSVAAKVAGFDPEVSGSGADTTVRDKKTGKLLVRVNPKYYRPAEVDQLLGDPRKAEEELGWVRECGFTELVERMVVSDIDRLKTGKPMFDRG